MRCGEGIISVHSRLEIFAITSSVALKPVRLRRWRYISLQKGITEIRAGWPTRCMTRTTLISRSFIGWTACWTATRGEKRWKRPKSCTIVPAIGNGKIRSMRIQCAGLNARTYYCSYAKNSSREDVQFITPTMAKEESKSTYEHEL